MSTQTVQKMYILVAEHMGTFVQECLPALNLAFLPAESDLPLGVITVVGTAENVALCDRFLAGEYVI